MRPLSLIAAKLALLVVHDLVEVLNQVQSDHAIVGGASLGEKGLPGLGRPGPQVVNVLGVEDGVDAAGPGLALAIVSGLLTYKGESSLGRKNSGRMINQVLELGYKVWTLLKISAAL